MSSLPTCIPVNRRIKVLSATSYLWPWGWTHTQTHTDTDTHTHTHTHTDFGRMKVFLRNSQEMVAHTWLQKSEKKPRMQGLTQEIYYFQLNSYI